MHKATHCLKIFQVEVHKSREVQLESREAVYSGWLSSTYVILNWLQNHGWYSKRLGYVPAKIIQVIYAESVPCVQNYILLCIISINHFHEVN